MDHLVLEKSTAKLKEPALTVREATLDDYPQITDLESRHGLQTRGYEEWANLWTGNPVCEQLGNWPIGWVCERADHKLVGCITNVPLAYEMGGRRLIAATSRSLVMEKPHGPYAFFLLGKFFAQTSVDLFLNTTVNANAETLQKFFRARRVPAGTWDRAIFWITSYRSFAKSALASKELPGIASYPLSSGLFLRDRLQGRPYKAPSEVVEVQSHQHFGTMFDDFWEQIRRSASGELLATRTSRVLNWHFGFALDNGRAWVLSISRGGELMAYGIFRRQDNPAFRLKRMRLVDFQCRPGQTALLKPILLHALQKCREESLDMLEALGFCREKEALLHSMRPHSRELTSWRYYYRTDQQQLGASLQKPNAWDPTCYDGDASL